MAIVRSGLSAIRLPGQFWRQCAATRSFDVRREYPGAGSCSRRIAICRRRAGVARSGGLGRGHRQVGAADWRLPSRPIRAICLPTLLRSPGFRMESRSWPPTTKRSRSPTWQVAKSPACCPSDLVLALAVSPDGKQLATGRFDGVTIWNLSERKKTAIHLNVPAVESVQFSPDGHRLAAGSTDGIVRNLESAELQSRRKLDLYAAQRCGAGSILEAISAGRLDWGLALLSALSPGEAGRAVAAGLSERSGHFLARHANSAKIRRTFFGFLSDEPASCVPIIMQPIAADTRQRAPAMDRYEALARSTN